MTFQECKEKYPIGYSIGVFNIEEYAPLDWFEEPRLEPGCAAWWTYNPILKMFYLITFIFNTVIGYGTEDGESFAPLQLNLERGEGFEFFPSSYFKDGKIIQLTEDKEKDLENIIQMWNESNNTIIKTKLDFELMKKHQELYGEKESDC